MEFACGIWRNSLIFFVCRLWTESAGDFWSFVVRRIQQNVSSIGSRDREDSGQHHWPSPECSGQQARKSYAGGSAREKRVVWRLWKADVLFPLIRSILKRTKSICWWIRSWAIIQFCVGGQCCHVRKWQAREIFMAQPVLLELEAPLKVVGDVHGEWIRCNNLDRV